MTIAGRQETRVVVVPTGALTQLVAVGEDGTPLGPAQECSNLAETAASMEADLHPRWIWDSTARMYAGLLREGVRLARCHDLSLIGSILAVRRGEAGEREVVLVDDRPGLFDAHRYPTADAVLGRCHEQLTALGGSPDLKLLAAAESAGALAAAEMSHDGLPFSAPAHLAYLESELGPRPDEGTLPVAMAELEAAVSDAFGRKINPSSPSEVVAAFGRAGIELTSTRAHMLRDIDHPAVPLLLRHRDLSKLFSTNGWAWVDTWVHQNRFRPVYVPGGVVSGRWASRGGGALQIPKTLRSSVIADDGFQFVIADAGQLEPRILAAMSRDRKMMEAAGSDDLYAPVAAAAFDGDRSKAKVAVLGVLYGATAGEARSLLTLLRRRFPDAVRFVETAARAGERGEVVHSLLGRACPQPTSQWWSQGDAHARGRFTRNFVVQATASEWALCLLADLRRRLAAHPGSGELVFFQHDEVVVHSREPETARRFVLEAASAATRLLFGDTPVRFPMDIAVRSCYADPE
ncbi:bifunctional 3'-5' exonuclease/DNA polymerase [Rhodococcus sp. G-MC3]|uniref:bifunctional 3'-5' exonuclease/DNA polymerase n=1 Tax=Rhodococcus sp. G-MC3 TaxID=3046209 RepID=UPI0024BAFD8C|nr:bifunctional 3'-5' exonuclease/DNA polymerase [Rhodococcus sp. G-MC3]MDJ0391972.1 bifunctional 3'-5' exonuclease/DNA polymerase [Rhodococcus sp. G-MC3]